MPTRTIKRTGLNIIEDHIPLPKYTKMTKSSKDLLVETMAKMKPLQSIILDNYTSEELNAARTYINTVLRDAEELNGMEFTVNVDPITDTKVRIWRKS